MILKSFVTNRWLPFRRSFRALTLAFLLSLSASGWAQLPYLSPGKPDGIALLPPPPKRGSAEEAADLATVRAVFKARTEEEKNRAFNDSALSFNLFAPAIGGDFDIARFPKTEQLLQNVKSDIGKNIDAPKNHYQRKRPYLIDETLALGKPEPSFSYPSGHSTRGTVYALVMAEVFPAKREAILAIGRNIGWDRVLIGKHFPTDIYAGRVLGQAIVRELLASPGFQHDLAEAKAEVVSIQAPARELQGVGK